MRFPEPDLVKFAVPIAMAPVMVVLPIPLKVRFPGPVIVGAILKRPDPLWSISKSLLAVRFPTPVPTVNPISAVDPEAIDILLLPELAEKVKLRAVSPVLVEVNRVRKLVSALASYVRLRIVKFAPRNELLEFAVAFALAELKIRSVVPLNAGAELQFEAVEKFPDVDPVHVCAKTTEFANTRITASKPIHLPNRKADEGKKGTAESADGLWRGGNLTFPISSLEFPKERMAPSAPEIWVRCGEPTLPWGLVFVSNFCIGLCVPCALCG